MAKSNFVLQMLYSNLHLKKNNWFFEQPLQKNCSALPKLIIKPAFFILFICILLLMIRNLNLGVIDAYADQLLADGVRNIFRKQKYVELVTLVNVFLHKLHLLGVQINYFLPELDSFRDQFFQCRSSKLMTEQVALLYFVKLNIYWCLLKPKWINFHTV